MRDKADFQNFKKQTTNISDLINKPEILGLLTQLISFFQPRGNSQFGNRQGGNMQMRQNYNNKPY